MKKWEIKVTSQNILNANNRLRDIKGKLSGIVNDDISSDLETIVTEFDRAFRVLDEIEGGYDE